MTQATIVRPVHPSRSPIDGGPSELASVMSLMSGTRFERHRVHFNIRDQQGSFGSKGIASIIVHIDVCGRHPSIGQMFNIIGHVKRGRNLTPVLIQYSTQNRKGRIELIDPNDPLLQMLKLE